MQVVADFTRHRCILETVDQGTELAAFPDTPRRDDVPRLVYLDTRSRKRLVREFYHFRGRLAASVGDRSHNSP